MPATRDQGSPLYQEGVAAPPKAQNNMARKHRPITIVLTASCWIFLLAIVLSSIFGESKQAKPIRGKDQIRSSRVIVLFAHLPAVANLFPLPRFALRSKSGENIVIGRQYFV